MSTVAFRIDSIEPILASDTVQATEGGVALWEVKGMTRTASGKKNTFHVRVAGDNAAQIRQAVKAIAKHEDDAEKVVKIKAPANIVAILGQPLDMKLDPVTDWDAVEPPTGG